MDGWVAPLAKPNGGVRPIALFDSFVKLATGSVLAASEAAVKAAVFPFQFGCGIEAGAEVMLKAVHALSRAKPHFCFVGTDVKNAFGTVSRLHTLKAAFKHAPVLATCLAQQWADGHQSLFIQTSRKEWTPMAVHDGVFQGEFLNLGV